MDAGQISLLNSTSEVASHGEFLRAHVLVGNVVHQRRNVYLYQISTSSVVQVTSFSGTAQALTTDGCNALIGAADGIYEIDGSLSTTKLYDHAGSGASWTVQAIGYVKDRIIVGCQITDAYPMRVFELGRNPASPPATINIATSGDSRYEYASTELSFVAVTETTSANPGGTEHRHPG